MRKLFIIAAVSLLLAITSGSVAYATTAMGSQNPDLTVFISLEPSCVTVGGTTVREFRVTNNTNKSQNVTLEARVISDGKLYEIYPNPDYPRDHWRVQLGPGETWQYGPTTIYFSPYFWPMGVYDVTLSATNKKGTSSATAQFEIYETTCGLGA